MKLEGRGAVVTGGGRGIGESVAGALARAGAAVVLASRTAKEIEAVAERLRAEGHRARALPCDVTDEASVESLARQAAEWCASLGIDGVDILVNNAGIAGSQPIHKLTLQEWNRYFAVNVTGTFLCTRALLPGMLERGRGRIVNIASVSGLAGARYIAGYSASKHAVIGFTRSVAAEAAAAAGAGVTVNAVCPGYVDTEMTRDSVRRIVEKTGRSEDEALGALLRASPQHRLIEPSEVAHAVLALLDEEARGINGQSIVIDGGALPA